MRPRFAKLLPKYRLAGMVGTEARTLGEIYSGGRDHWWESGFAVFAGGGLRMGQVVGETDGRAERSRGRPYTPQNVLAT